MLRAVSISSAQTMWATRSDSWITEVSGVDAQFWWSQGDCQKAAGCPITEPREDPNPTGAKLTQEAEEMPGL